jgi:hypothetical protein
MPTNSRIKDKRPGIFYTPQIRKARNQNLPHQKGARHIPLGMVALKYAKQVLWLQSIGLRTNNGLHGLSLA